MLSDAGRGTHVLNDVKESGEEAKANPYFKLRAPTRQTLLIGSRELPIFTNQQK